MVVDINSHISFFLHCSLHIKSGIQSFGHRCFRFLIIDYVYQVRMKLEFPLYKKMIFGTFSSFVFLMWVYCSGKCTA
eukprot:c21343_g2_i1 orf=331-561(+)